LALGGRRLMTKHINQPKVGGSGRGGYWGGRATAVKHVGGAFRYHLGRQKEDEETNNEKYIVAFSGL